MADDPLVSLAKVVDSDHLRARVNGLFDRLLDEVEWQFDNATPAGRNALLQKALPIIVAATRSDEDDEELEGLRTQMTQMNETLLQLLNTPVRPPIETTSRELPPTDDPPPTAG